MHVVHTLQSDTVQDAMGLAQEADALVLLIVGVPTSLQMVMPLCVVQTGKDPLYDHCLVQQYTPPGLQLAKLAPGKLPVISLPSISDLQLDIWLRTNGPVTDAYVMSKRQQNAPIPQKQEWNKLVDNMAQ